MMMSDIRDRVIGFRRVRADQIRPHPKNWREHPPEQRKIYRTMLEEIGFAGALLCYEDPDHGLTLIDGELRQMETPKAMLPVLVTDLTPEEAEMLLFGFDSVGAMAQARLDRLAELKALMEARRNLWR
jgi:hypothetical protein